MVRSGEAVGWFVLVFFALVAIVSAVVMLPGTGRLVLDKDGFEAKVLFRAYRKRWPDTRGFIATTIPGPGNTRLVAYDDLTQGGGMANDLNVAITDRNAALGDTFGLSADDLARLMEQWRERALMAPGAPR